MFISTTIGIVTDNADPDHMNRVKVKFNTESFLGESSHSSWCRMISPMAGMSRGMVMLPEVGTEVLVGFAYQSMTPYILGGVYNGVDLPEPYRNDDCLNNVRVFWSRNDHMVLFDDTEGMEKVSFGAGAPIRLNVQSAGIHSILDSSQMVATTRCDGDTIVEAGQKVSVRCRHFNLEASNSVDIESGASTNIAAGMSASIEAGVSAEFNAGTVSLNPGAPTPIPASSLESPLYKHPPVRAGALEQVGSAASAGTAAIGEDQGEAGDAVEAGEAGEAAAGEAAAGEAGAGGGPAGGGPAGGGPAGGGPAGGGPAGGGPAGGGPAGGGPAGGGPAGGLPGSTAGGTPGPAGDAWDDLREKTKGAVGSTVSSAVSDALGGTVGAAIGKEVADLAEDLVEKGVDKAFDAVEDAVESAFDGIGGGTSGGGKADSSTAKPPGEKKPSAPKKPLPEEIVEAATAGADDAEEAAAKPAPKEKPAPEKKPTAKKEVDPKAAEADALSPPESEES